MNNDSLILVELLTFFMSSLKDTYFPFCLLFESRTLCMICKGISYAFPNCKYRGGRWVDELLMMFFDPIMAIKTFIHEHEICNKWIYKSLSRGQVRGYNMISFPPPIIPKVNYSYFQTLFPHHA